MLMQGGLRTHLMQALPNTTFTVIVDPECIQNICSSAMEPVLQLILDLSLLRYPIKIRLLTTGAEHLLIEQIASPKGSFVPSKLKPEDPRHKFLGSAPTEKPIQDLCVLAQEFKADGLLTSNSTLIEARYSLYQHDLIWIIPVTEWSDFIEICAHGHGVFWSASHDTALIHDVYYPLAHREGARLAKWFSIAHPHIKSEEILDHLRSAVHNRFPFILYARDMVRFYQLQKDNYKRSDNPDRFVFPLAYHQNMFSLLVWGMLEHLCLLSNMIFGIDLHPKDCGIAKKDFWKAIEPRCADLASFIKEPPIAEWIETLSGMRHAGAHHKLPMPAALRMRTEHSNLPKDEVLAKIMEEDSESRFLLNYPWPEPEMKAAIEEQMVFQWRCEHLEEIADHMVLLKTKRGEYFYNPVISIDADLHMLTKVVDKFFEEFLKAFQGSPTDRVK